MTGLFQFLMVLESMIIGLGLAEILTGLGQLLRARHERRIAGVHATVVALVLVGLLQHWWDTWGLRGLDRWSFPGLLLFLSGPITLFLLAYLVLPQTVEDTHLEEYYYLHAPVLWGLGLVYLVTTVLFRPLVAGAELLSAPNMVRAVGAVLCVTLASTRRKSVHASGVAVAAVLLAVYVSLFSFWQVE